MPKPKPQIDQRKLAWLFRTGVPEIERMVKKEALPYKSRKKGITTFDLAKVIQWFVDRHRRQLEEEKARRDTRTLPEIAQLLDVEPRTINKEVKERGLPKEARGVFLLTKVLPWKAIDQRKQLRDARTGGETESQARKGLWQANRDLKLITLARQRGEVINIDDAIPILERGLNILRQKVMIFPKTAAPQLEGLETPAEREQTLKTLAHDLLTDLATIPDALRSAAKLGHQSTSESIPDAPASSANDGKRVGRRKKVAQRRNRKRTG
jgi:phage terminase Nu1 subunit (DNA packaging protein)